MSGRGYRRHRIESLESRIALDASALRITEFLASNSGGLMDAGGDDADWIEIYNSGPESVDLAGLYLTDDSTDLTQWQFPDGPSLSPGEFLIVFASGDDPAPGDNELNASFAISADGEYLALVDADGVTVIDEYAPEFPTQQENISYGREMSVVDPSVMLLEEGAVASGLLPTNGSLGLTWTEIDYDDAGWPYAGPTGFGYENNPGSGTNYVDEIETLIPPGTTSFYLRVPFEVASKADLGALQLNLRFDDGFVAYLNGVRVAEANAPDVLTFASSAAGGQSDPTAEQFRPFDVSAAIPHLRVGENVLAIHALNNENSSDMLISPELMAFGSEIAAPPGIGHFTSPTPGWGNFDQSVAGYAAAPEFSVPHGFYDASQSVELTTATEDAMIVYTTDGSAPAVGGNLNIINGSLYTGELTVNSTTTLRAATFKQDFEPSFVSASSYIFLDDVIGQSPNGEPPAFGWPDDDVNGQEINYGMDPEVIDLYSAEQVKQSLASLTTFSITTDVDNLFDDDIGIFVNAGNRGRDWERPASVELIDPTGAEEGFTVNAGLRIRGGFSRSDGNPKHAFRFYFRSDYGDAKLNYALFGDEGTDEFDVLDLRTSQNYSWSFQGNPQNTFLREVFARDLQRDLGQEYTRSRYHHLYVDGVYWGVFMTQERVQKDFGESYFGGDEEDYDVVKSDNINGRRTEIADGNDVAWRQLFDLAEELSTDPVNNADNYWTMQGLNPDGTRNQDLPVLLDVDNLIDYVMSIFYTGGYDTGISQFLGDDIGNNWQGIYNRTTADQGFQFFMHDNEHSLGTNGTDDIDRTGPFNNGNHTVYEYFNPHFLHQDLIFSSAYVNQFANRALTHLTDGGAMTPEASIARMTARMNEVEPAIIAEAARWGDAQRSVPFNKSHWQTEVNSILNQYFPARTETVINQLVTDGLFWPLAPPTLSIDGGEVAAGTLLELFSPARFILYTVDGADPRLFNGAVNRASIEIYTEPISINSSQTVNVRAFESGGWSSLVSATFTVPLIGDYDHSGVIDGGDLAVWESEFLSGVPANADGNHDGVVDGLDFLAMQRNHGANIAQQAATDVASSVASTTEQLIAVQTDLTSELLATSDDATQIAAVALGAPHGDAAVDVDYFVNPRLIGRGVADRIRDAFVEVHAHISQAATPIQLDQALAAIESYRIGRPARKPDGAADPPTLLFDSEDQLEADVPHELVWSELGNLASGSAGISWLPGR